MKKQFTGVGGVQGSHRGPWMGEAPPPQSEGTKAVESGNGNSVEDIRWRRRQELQQVTQVSLQGTRAGGEAWRVISPRLINIGTLSECDTTFIFSFATDI